MHATRGRKARKWLWVLTAALVAVVAFVAALATAPSTASAASRDHGASFAVRCDFSHRSSDDPIVHPGNPGAAHSHDFFGNVSTKFDSTYDTMVAAGTTCTRPEDTAAYWIPTVSWEGQEGTQVLTSNRAVFYYRAGGKDHTKVKPFARDLRVIPNTHIRWGCGRLDNGGGSADPPTQCDSGELGVRIIFPDCVAVDPKIGGQQLDSADHRSHMAYSRKRDGKIRCPRSRPIPVPALTMNVTFQIPTTPGKVILSSGDASTIHADFWNTWNQDAPLNLNPPDGRSFGGLNALVKHCINEVPPSQPRPEECQAPPPPRVG